MKRAWLIAAIMFSGGATAQLLAPRDIDSLRTEAAEYGMPLPLTAEAVNALPAEVRVQHASAIKRVYLLQHLQYMQDGYTMTDGNRMAVIYLATKLNAPAEYIQLLQVEAAGSLSARQYTLLGRLYERLYTLYGVDVLGIRFFAESELAPRELVADMSAELPLASLFNLVKEDTITTGQAAADLQEVAAVFTELVRLYESITNAEQAAAALPQVRELVSRFGKVYPGLVLAPEAVRKQLAPAYSLKIQPLIPFLVEHRKRLRDADFYGNAQLKILDYFFD